MKQEITLSKNLQDLLKSQRYSASTIASRVKMNKSTLHGWTNGVIPQPLKALVALSQYFNISLDELCLGQTRSFVESEDLILSIKLKIERDGSKKISWNMLDPDLPK